MNQTHQPENESEIEAQHNQQVSLVSSFVSSFETNRDIIKKFGQACSIFSQHLEEISKLDCQQTDQPLSALSQQLTSFFSQVSQEVKMLGSSIIGSYSYLKDQIKPIKQFKKDCKDTYLEHKKIYQQIKREYEQSSQKVEEIQQKLANYTKSVCPLEIKQSQQYQLLKHQDKLAKNEQKIRYQNKKECLTQLLIFVQEQQELITQTFIKQFKTVKDQALGSITQFHATFNQLQQFSVQIREDKSMRSKQSIKNQQFQSTTLQQFNKSRSSTPQRQGLISQNILREESNQQRILKSNLTKNSSRNTSSIPHIIESYFINDSDSMIDFKKYDVLQDRTNCTSRQACYDKSNYTDRQFKPSNSFYKDDSNDQVRSKWSQKYQNMQKQVY